MTSRVSITKHGEDRSWRRAVKLHHIHAAPRASRVEFDDLDRMAWRGEGGGLPIKREVARRLAVCWNVLEGIPTEALESGSLREMFEALAAGDLDRARRAAPQVEDAVELTEDGYPHACKACGDDAPGAG
jgi:hypothetical protein